jgi:hypothetical protein
VASADGDQADFTGASRPLHGALLMARMAQRPPKEPGLLTRLGHRYASTRRPWSLMASALVIGAAVIVVAAFFLANKQFAVALGAAAFGVVLAWLLRVRTPRGQ